MNWLDLLFIAIFVSSVVLGFARGLARVTVGLAATILGVLFASRWYAEAGFFLRDYVSSPSVSNGIGFILVLLLFIVVGGILSKLLAAAFKWAGIGWLDRLLGGAFGVLRAMLISIAIVMVGMAFPRNTLPQAIVESRFAPYIVEASRVLAAVTPDELKNAFTRNYDEVKKIWAEMVDQGLKKLPEAHL